MLLLRSQRGKQSFALRVLTSGEEFKELTENLKYGDSVKVTAEWRPDLDLWEPCVPSVVETKTGLRYNVRMAAPKDVTTLF